MADLFDRYTLEARWAPAMVVIAPLLATLVLAGAASGISITALLGGWAFITLPLALLAASVVRACGKKAEPVLWASWDGPPTTRYLRWRDPTLPLETKESLHQAVEQQFGLTLLRPDKERANLEEADRRIGQAIRHVRELLRREAPDGLWFRQLAEYGFARNLLGARCYWVASSLVPLLISLELYRRSVGIELMFASAVDGAFLIIAVIIGWRVLPGLSRSVAERYAETLLISFLAVIKETSNA